MSTTDMAGELTRRGFLAAAMAGMGGLSWERALGAVAGPFTAMDFEDYPIPVDKKFDAAWIASLTARGAPTVYSSLKDELKYIGMPIGGICCGQVYLGGDGRLWHWDIFNTEPEAAFRSSAGPHYAKPAPLKSPFENGFAIEVTSGDAPPQIRSLDRRGLQIISFRGQYPIGLVDFKDVDTPYEVSLEAFSPFIPLDENESGLPAVVLNYTVKNTSSADIKVSLGGWLQNPVCLVSGKQAKGKRRNRLVRASKSVSLNCSAEPPSAAELEQAQPARPDIVFEDWEKGTYEGWTVTGKAFGDKPRNLSDIAAYQGDVNAQGKWTVNTHETRHGEDVGKADTYIGTLSSREFTIERDYIRFRIGGGNRPGQECLNLLIDGAPVRTATGRDSNRMHLDHFDVKEFKGQKARVQIVDGFSGGWGQIGVDEIVFTDSAELESIVLEEQPDFGTMTLMLLDEGKGSGSASFIGDKPKLPLATFDQIPDHEPDQSADLDKALIGSVFGSAELKTGQSRTFTFILAWHFDGLWCESLSQVTNIKTLRRHYGTRFKDSAAVAAHVADNLGRLSAVTRLWRDTWYDSTLPHWLLDRAFANNSTLATSTCFRFSNGRFYGWEGTHCCAGTCQHVWQYAQGVARTFPALERFLREEIDFGTAFHEDTGAVDYRGEAHRIVAHDGLCGTIIRAYREHTMSSDDAFLKRRWPRIKKSIEFMMREDGDEDGILEGSQYNTLDAAWYGPMGWISSLYLGALRAGEAMAREMGDHEFASRCGAICDRGMKNLVARLYNGEYFIHKPDPKHPEANNTNDGCHIDQVFGQSMAFQAGLARVVPEVECKSALKALYKYSFAPDIGPYRAKYDAMLKGGRWYAMPGEGGLLMCTFPKGGAERATGKGGDAWAAGYFQECMNGFEHQVASHMVWEGMVEEGLAIFRMLHDRYHAARRNPWNEVECSDHYARSMASYGVFVAACGFRYHGPRGEMAFAPRLSPENFRAPFTAAEGWGTYSQKTAPGAMHAELWVKHGQVRLTALELAAPPGMTITGGAAAVEKRTTPVRVIGGGVEFDPAIIVREGETLKIGLTLK